MSAAINRFEPDYAIHPGEYLEEVLETRGMQKNELAQRCNLTPKTVSQIINGRAAFSPEVALQFEMVLDISADIWLNLLTAHTLHQIRRREHDTLAKAKAWAEQFPLRDLRRAGVIAEKDSSVRCVRDLLRFFNVSSPDAWEKLYGERAPVFRKSPTLESSWHAVATWLRMAELQAHERTTEPFDPRRLRQAVRQIRDLTTRGPEVFEPAIVESCAQAGVAVVFIPELSGCRLSGATEWLAPDKAMIALSLRHKSDDHFWFTLFHELGHVILHGKKPIFIDGSPTEQAESEREANEFARNQLVPKHEYRKFVARGKFYQSDIVAFAEEQGLAPGIIVGMLQHDGHIEYSWHNKLKRRLHVR